MDPTDFLGWAFGVFICVLTVIAIVVTVVAITSGAIH